MNSVKFTEDAHGMRVLKISNNSADALVYLHGGHVASFKPKGSADLLWMSKMSMFENGKPIRGTDTGRNA